jgi:hypothetical protein
MVTYGSKRGHGQRQKTGREEEKIGKLLIKLHFLK